MSLQSKAADLLAAHTSGSAPMSVTLRFEDEVDVSRGNMIVRSRKKMKKR